MHLDLAPFFDRYDWSYKEVDESIWLTTFFTEDETEYDLFVAAREEWVHFAILPFAPRPIEACQHRLCTFLLRLNQQLRLARFSLDEEGDISLQIDRSADDFTYGHFTQSLELLSGYAQTLGKEVARTGQNPNYFSPLLSSNRA